MLTRDDVNLLVSAVQDVDANPGIHVHLSPFNVEVPWAWYHMLNSGITKARDAGAVVHAEWSDPKGPFRRRECVITGYGVGPQILPLLKAMLLLPKEGDR